MTDEYEFELTIRDANGKRFGTRVEVKPDLLERVLVEVAHVASRFAEGDDEFNAEARERCGFERITDA